MRWRRLSPRAVPATARLAARAAARARARARRAATARQAADAFALRRLILRDHLAVERTRLANERTVLSYVRTAFALVAGAATLAHLYGAAAAFSVAALGAAGVGVLALGVWRYRASAQATRAYALFGDPPDDLPVAPLPDPPAGGVSPPAATASSGA